MCRGNHVKTVRVECCSTCFADLLRFSPTTRSLKDIDDLGEALCADDDDDDSDADQEVLPSNFFNDEEDDDIDLDDLADGAETDDEEEEHDSNAPQSTESVLLFEHMGEELPHLVKAQRRSTVLDTATGEQIKIATAAAMASEHSKLSSDRCIRVRQAKKRVVV